MRIKPLLLFLLCILISLVSGCGSLSPAPMPTLAPTVAAPTLAALTAAAATTATTVAATTVVATTVAAPTVLAPTQADLTAPAAAATASTVAAPTQAALTASVAATATATVPSSATPAHRPSEPFLCQISGPEVYLVVDGQRRHIADWDTFVNLGYTADQVQACGPSVAFGEGAPLTRLLKGSGEEVYWLENGQRRHIPDMETFRALGNREQDIAVVPDELLATWPLGEPLPAWHAPPTAPPITAAAPAAPPSGTLRDALKSVHDQFQIDPSRGCFELLSPYPDYHRGLQQMTALLLTDPRAQALSYAEREALFKDVTGFDGVRFFAGPSVSESGAPTLVSLRTNRGYNVGCGSHYASPDALHVVDAQGAIYDLGVGGLLAQTWQMGNRWIALFRLKLDSSSGPTRWAVWHIGLAGEGWQKLVEFEFAPTPYNFDPPPALRFENGYQTMTADLEYWWADDPCEFTAEFTDTYQHGTWQMRRTYQLAGSTYELVSWAVLTFTVQRKDTGEPVTLDWKSYCAGPIK